MARGGAARSDGKGSAVKFMAKHNGELFPIEVERHGGGYRVKVRDRWIDADLISPTPHLRSLRLEDGTQHLLVHHRDGAEHQISFGDRTVHLELYDPLALKRGSTRDDLSGAGGSIRAVMPGRVVRVTVAAGDEVQSGAPLLVLEAMKMQNEITAPKGGSVTAVHVKAGDAVESGAELVTIE